MDGDNSKVEAFFIVHAQTDQREPQEALGRYMFKSRKKDSKWKLAGIDASATVWKGSRAPPYERFIYERFSRPLTKKGLKDEEKLV